MLALLFVLLTLILLIAFIARLMKAPTLIKKSLLTFFIILLVTTSVLLVVEGQKTGYRINLTNIFARAAEKVHFFDHLDELKAKEFGVYDKGKHLKSFHTFKEAVQYAKNSGSDSQVHYQYPNNIVWQQVKSFPVKIMLDVELINQMPELPRGCEVTSLAMLLRNSGLEADKMQLAKEIKKDNTPYEIREGLIYFGNPHVGFVGNMYDYNKPGLGVYHGPIKELAEKYAPGKVVDMTGVEFSDILYSLTQGRPVWVIINTRYMHISENQFQTWQTPTGQIQITYRMHSVVITGYDADTIYFNDPLTNIKNRKMSRKGFEAAWLQMGRQAITIID